jgi:hypothetical protein
MVQNKAPHLSDKKRQKKPVTLHVKKIYSGVASHIHLSYYTNSIICAPPPPQSIYFMGVLWDFEG